MGAITSLEHRSITVQPGEEATCSVLLRNAGTVVDQFTVEVLGDAQPWAQADPATVNLLPNEESTVVIRFQPPRSPQVPAGVVPFGIRVASREDPAGSVVEEGTLDVGAFTDVRIELVPRQTRGRRQAKCEVAVDNLGNHPVALGIDADDADRMLRFRPEHTDLTLQPGTTAFLGLTIRAEQGFLRGPERTHPFQVRVSGADVPPTSAEGAMVQQPLLPRWLPIALAALLAGLIALVVLWFTLLKPTLKSSAQEAAAEQVQGVANTANQAKERAEEAAQAAGLPPKPDAAKPPGGNPSTSAPAPPAPPGGPVPPGGPAPPGGAPVSESIDFRITTDAKTTADLGAFTRFPLPDADPLAPRFAGKTLAISDLVLQNPFGDTGTLHVLRVTGQGDTQRETVLLEVGLGNFRDLDYHFLQPWLFKPGERVMLAVSCQNPPLADAPAPNCRPSASFSGQLQGPPPPPPPPSPSPSPSISPTPSVGNGS